MKKSIFIIVLLFLIESCAMQKLEMVRTDFTTNEFNTHGFYFGKQNKSDRNSESCYIFYKNGALINFGYDKSVNDLKKFLNDETAMQGLKELPYWWGVFKVQNDSIRIEKWISYDAFGGYPTRKYIGKIIDSNTIVLNIPRQYPSGETEMRQETLHFYPFESKPDSTNTFIKN